LFGVYVIDQLGRKPSSSSADERLREAHARNQARWDAVAELVSTSGPAAENLPFCLNASN
jgi:hypothetical protein